jgi:Pyruvate/2-oxoacid:ferredoxin oxidoreductase delta subunit
VFAGGDAVTGALTVVDAIAAGKRAAWGIDVYLRGAEAAPLDLPPAREEVIDASRIAPEPGRITRAGRVRAGAGAATATATATATGAGASARAPAPPAPSEVGGSEAEGSAAGGAAFAFTFTFTGSPANTEARDYGAEEAGEEAGRCLACGRCAHCRACVETLACPAITVDGERVAIDPAACNGCTVCAQICANGAIERVGR